MRFAAAHALSNPIIRAFKRKSVLRWGAAELSEREFLIRSLKSTLSCRYGLWKPEGRSTAKPKKIHVEPGKTVGKLPFLDIFALLDNFLLEGKLISTQAETKFKTRLAEPVVRNELMTSAHDASLLGFRCRWTVVRFLYETGHKKLLCLTGKGNTMLWAALKILLCII